MENMLQIDPNAKVIIYGAGSRGELLFNPASALVEIFDEKNPNVICVELDKQRLNALIMKNTKPKEYKINSKNVPFIYRLLARFQNGMAKEYGVIAGDEMLTAIKYANHHDIPLEFIDMNAQNLFSKMLRTMSLSEKFKLILSGFSGLLISKKRVENELELIENDFDNYIKQIGEKFPTIKKILIDDRNIYMAKKLIKINEEKNRIVACIGDGHISGISKILDTEKIDYETIRLSDLRKKSFESISETASFSVEYNKPLPDAFILTKKASKKPPPWVPFSASAVTGKFVEPVEPTKYATPLASTSKPFISSLWVSPKNVE